MLLSIKGKDSTRTKRVAVYATINKNPLRLSTGGPNPSQGVTVEFSEELTELQKQRMLSGPYSEGTFVVYADGKFGYTIQGAFAYSVEVIKDGIREVFGADIQIFENE